MNGKTSRPHGLPKVENKSPSRLLRIEDPLHDAPPPRLETTKNEKKCFCKYVRHYEVVRLHSLQKSRSLDTEYIAWPLLAYKTAVATHTVRCGETLQHLSTVSCVV